MFSGVRLMTVMGKIINVDGWMGGLGEGDLWSWDLGFGFV
jgi:hypothetical protein